MILDDRVAQDLRDRYAKLLAAGELLSQSQLEECYRTFREKFGPDVLRALDGEALLNTVHDHSNRDSLVYWLEFKNDDELPARFGSIAGGSALKFGIYRRRETRAWMTGSSRNQYEISTEQAIEIARKHRDQLLRGAEILDALPDDGGDDEYKRLQEQMDEHAPDVSNLAWGHKYFAMLSPTKLDDYHSPAYQRFHLTAVLQLPPEGEGRYVAAGRFVAMARQLDMPVNHLTTVLNRRTRIRSYWRVDTGDATQPRNRWSLMRDGSCVAIGWPQLGDLSTTDEDSELRQRILEQVSEQYPDRPKVARRHAQQVFNFVAKIQEEDIVVASDGATVLGIGKVLGDYVFDASSDYPHRRPVSWLSIDEWKLPEPEGLRTSVARLRRHAVNQVEIERQILKAGEIEPPPDVGPPKPEPVRRFDGLLGRIQAVLDRKGQVVIYGPPGTGKTYWAEKAAREFAAHSCFGADYAELTNDQRNRVDGDGQSCSALVRTCCFHPGYGYENFIEGYRPHAVGDQMHFVLRDGVFKKLCHDARESPDQTFYLIIDEINRGDIPRIFGELLLVLEKDKRGRRVVLPVSGESFSVPPNVRIIGTMNTADRSIALLDTALRRRFGFIELMPDISVLEGAVVEGIPLGQWLRELNQRICAHVGRDARNLQIGHAYLLYEGRPVSRFTRLARIVRDDLIPLLQEYCYEDYAALEQILGQGLVDRETQTIRHGMFEESMKEELIQALMAQCPEISTSLEASAAEDEPAEDEADVNDDGDDEP